jgi:hypothetical protein
VEEILILLKADNEAPPILCVVPENTRVPPLSVNVPSLIQLPYRIMLPLLLVMLEPDLTIISCPKEKHEKIIVDKNADIN